MIKKLWYLCSVLLCFMLMSCTMPQPPCVLSNNIMPLEFSRELSRTYAYSAGLFRLSLFCRKKYEDPLYSNNDNEHAIVFNIG